MTATLPLDTDITGVGGHYTFIVAPGFYKVFVPSHSHGANQVYYGEWYDNAEFIEDADLIQVNPGATNTDVWTLLEPIPWLFRFQHPPYGVVDGPDRFETWVDFYGWGLHSVLQRPDGAVGFPVRLDPPA